MFERRVASEPLKIIRFSSELRNEVGTGCRTWSDGFFFLQNVFVVAFLSRTAELIQILSRSHLNLLSVVIIFRHYFQSH